MAILLPIITKVVNSSLFSGIFPDTLKQSIITPVLKKLNLDHNILKHYRPVANIKFLSKVIEKAASCQVGSHIDRNDLGERNQSSYKKFHSTETALLKVKSDFLQYVDDSKSVLLVLLDMSAAFDTVDHPILLQRLRDRFGMCDSVVSWFRSYFENRTTRVSIKNASSHKHILNYSLPQGSIIGPQCFILYISPIGDIIRQIRHHNISFHCYADDIQLYAAFDHKIPGECERTMDRITNCISELNMWMLQNKLQLNQEKTEFFVIAGPRVLNLVSDLQLKLDGKTIKPSISVKNLGVTFDGLMNMSIHISTLCKTINFQIRNLWRIRRFISREACHHAVRALVLSRIDYANSLLFGARQADLKRLQRVQNKAASLVFACGRDGCSADLLHSLHWLQVKDRIHFIVFGNLVHNNRSVVPVLEYRMAGISLDTVF